MKTKKNTKAKPEPPREVPQRLFPMVEGKPKPTAPAPENVYIGIPLNFKDHNEIELSER